MLSATAGHGSQVRGVGMHDARGDLSGYHLGVALGLRSHHATAPHREIAEDVAQGFLGSTDLHLQDGFDEMRLRIHEGLAEGVFACDLEGHVLGIDRVLFAVIEVDFHITDLVAREDAVALGDADSFLDRGDEVAIHVVAHQRMTKLDAAIARERLDTHPDLRELAGTSTLFLVAVLRFSLRVDGLAVGNARLIELDLDVVAPFEGFRDSLEMNLALSGEDGLLQFGIRAELEGGILLVNDGQAFRHLLLVTPSRQLEGGVNVGGGVFDPGRACLQFGAAGGSTRVTVGVTAPVGDGRMVVNTVAEINGTILLGQNPSIIPTCPLNQDSAGNQVDILGTPTDNLFQFQTTAAPGAIGVGTTVAFQYGTAFPTANVSVMVSPVGLAAAEITARPGPTAVSATGFTLTFPEANASGPTVQWNVLSIPINN